MIVFLCNRPIGNIHCLVETRSLDEFPIVTFELRHDVNITKDRLSVDDGQSNICINGFDEVSIGVLMEGIQNNKIA